MQESLHALDIYLCIPCAGVCGLGWRKFCKLPRSKRRAIGDIKRLDVCKLLEQVTQILEYYSINFIHSQKMSMQSTPYA